MKSPLLAHPQKVAAVIVTFNSHNLEELFSRVLELSQEVALVILSDNTDDGAVASKIQEFCKSRSGICYLGDGVNRGIGYAQNLAFESKEAEQCDFFVTFDQDSKFYKGLVTSLCEAYNSVADTEKLACMGPALVNERSGEVYGAYTKGRRLNSQVCVADHIASSGMLIPRAVLADVGTMKAEWFIDLLDVEWCYRAQSMGYVVGVALGVAMPHSFGSNDFIAPFGKRIVIPAPVRLFYIYRNTLLFARLKYIPWSVRAKLLLTTLTKAPIYCLSGQVGKRVSCFLKGLYSGVVLKL